MTTHPEVRVLIVEDDNLIQIKLNFKQWLNKDDVGVVEAILHKKVLSQFTHEKLEDQTVQAIEIKCQLYLHKLIQENCIYELVGGIYRVDYKFLYFRTQEFEE